MILLNTILYIYYYLLGWETRWGKAMLVINYASIDCSAMICENAMIIASGGCRDQLALLLQPSSTVAWGAITSL